MCSIGRAVCDVEEMVRLRRPRAYSRGEKRWPASSLFIDDDKPCRGCHSNHPPLALCSLHHDSGDVMVKLNAHTAMMSIFDYIFLGFKVFPYAGLGVGGCAVRTISSLNLRNRGIACASQSNQDPIWPVSFISADTAEIWAGYDNGPPIASLPYSGWGGINAMGKLWEPRQLC